MFKDSVRGWRNLRIFATSLVFKKIICPLNAMYHEYLLTDTDRALHAVQVALGTSYVVDVDPERRRRDSALVLDVRRKVLEKNHIETSTAFQV